MIRENVVSSKKSLDVQKCCVAVLKIIVVIMIRLTSTSLAANDSKKEHWKTVAIVDQCQSFAKFWRNLLIQLQPKKYFKLFSIVLLRMNKQRKDVLLLSKKNSRRRWNTHKTITIKDFDYSFNCLSVFIDSN